MGLSLWCLLTYILHSSGLHKQLDLILRLEHKEVNIYNEMTHNYKNVKQVYRVYKQFELLSLRYLCIGLSGKLNKGKKIVLSISVIKMKHATLQATTM